MTPHLKTSDMEEGGGSGSEKCLLPKPGPNPGQNDSGRVPVGRHAVCSVALLRVSLSWGFRFLGAPDLQI